MVMNKGLQIHVIKEKFKKQDVHDLDLQSLIDSELSLPENIQNLKDKGKLKEPKDRYNSADVKDRMITAQIKQAIESLEEKHELSKKEAETDSGITAESTFTPPLTEEEFMEWVNDPSEYDIEGIDTKGDALQMSLEFE